MQVILQEKIRKLGGIGDIVNVKPGFARNYLIRHGKAMIASKQNIEQVQSMRAELEKIENARIKEAKAKVATIEALGTIELNVHTNEEGKLFGSVGAAEIVEWIQAKGQEVHKSEVSIMESPVRFVGTFTVHVECYAEVIATLKLEVKSDSVKEKAPEQSTEVDEEAQEEPNAETDSE